MAHVGVPGGTAYPEPIRDAWLNFTVLGLAVLFKGYSFGVAGREMRRRHADVELWSALRRSKDPTPFTVILEGGAALTGLGKAAIGVAVSSWRSNQDRRAAFTSSRSCSAAWPVFFCA